jgi:hypothetical protein
MVSWFPFLRRCDLEVKCGKFQCRDVLKDLYRRSESRHGAVVQTEEVEPDQIREAEGDMAEHTGL